MNLRIDVSLGTSAVEGGRNITCRAVASRRRRTQAVMKRLLFLLLVSGITLQGQAPAFDLVIRHGTIVDGSGLPRYTGDVAIKNGFIVAIGNFPGTATNEIEARGMFV